MRAREKTEVIRAGKNIDAFEIEVANWVLSFKGCGGRPYASFIKGQGRHEGEYLTLAQKVAIARIMGEKI